MMASRSPSRTMVAPDVVLIWCISDSEASDGAGLVRVYFDEVLGAGHRQHRLDAYLDARELEPSAGAAHLPVQIHQAADSGAVDIGDRSEVNEDVALAARHQRGDGRREVPENRIHQPWLADAHDRNAASLVGCQIHQCTPPARRCPVGLNCSPRSFLICRASSVRPRLMRDLTVPSGSFSLRAIS